MLYFPRIRDGGPVNKPPILDGTNYNYWKENMDAFLKSIDNKTWKVVIKGLKHLVGTSEGWKHLVITSEGWNHLRYISNSHNWCHIKYVVF